MQNTPKLFTNTDSVYAEVKEELRSYFDTGSVDDLMFDKWTLNALGKLGRSAFPVRETFIPLNNYTGELPCDFKYVRELWVCGILDYKRLPNPSSVYYQQDCRVTRIMDRCDDCFDEEDINCCDECDDNHPSQLAKYQVTFKHTGQTFFEYRFKGLLKPGNNHAYDLCGKDCPNIGVNGMDTFDIRDGKLVTNFRDGNLHLIYYSDNTDEDGILIEDEFRLQDYIRKSLIYNVFRQLSNQVTDETFNQIQLKKQEAKMEMDIAQVELESYKKSQTIMKKANAISRINNRFNYFRRSLR